MKKKLKIVALLISSIAFSPVYNELAMAAETNLAQGYVCINNQLYKIKTRSPYRGTNSQITSCPNKEMGLLCHYNQVLKAGEDYESQNKSCKITSATGPGPGSNGYTWATCMETGNPYNNIVNAINKSLAVSFYHDPGGNGEWTLVIDRNVMKDLGKDDVDLSKVSFDMLAGPDLNKIHLANEINPQDTKEFNLTQGSVSDYFDDNLKEKAIQMKGGTNYLVNFYYTDSGDVCDQTYLGYIRGRMGSNGKSLVNTRACGDVKDSNKVPDEWKKKFFQECYEEITNSRRSEKNISEQLTKVEKLFDSFGYKDANGSIATNTKSASYTCEFRTGIEDSGEFASGNVQEKISVYRHFLDNGDLTDNKYWTAVCTETLSLSYDEPKATIAGGGFDYTSQIKIVRECYPYKIADPVYYPKCEYDIECYGGNVMHDGEAAAGPNEKFDSCIKECDGGIYTQNCIKACYQQIYSFSRSGNLKNKQLSFLNTDKQTNVVRLATIALSSGAAQDLGKVDGNAPRLPRSSYCVTAGSGTATMNQNEKCATEVRCDENPNSTSHADAYKCKTEHGVEHVYSSLCQEDGNYAKCYEVYTNYPCSTNPATDIYTSFVQEFEEVQAAIQKLDDEEEKSSEEKDRYAIEIKENYNLGRNNTYLNQVTTAFHNYGTYINNEKRKEFKITMEKDIKFKVIEGDEIELNPQGTHDTKSGDNDYSYRRTTEKTSIITKTVTIDIGEAYQALSNNIEENRKEGQFYYNKEKQNKMQNNLDYKYSGTKYFTNLNTEIVNRLGTWPYVLSYDNYTHPDHPYHKEYVQKVKEEGISEAYKIGNGKMNTNTREYDQNITVVLNNLGSWNQWGKYSSSEEKNSIEINCFYGIDYRDDDDGDDDDIPTPTPIGKQYIYRPIELSDVFPNQRLGRWNWTGTILSDGRTTGAALTKDKSGLGYEIDPLALLKHIENKEESIYDLSSGEVDYEFVLTSNNIRAIRRYNKEVRDFNQDGSNNYLDYDLNCKNQGGRSVCTSNFLDNKSPGSTESTTNQYVTYSVANYTIDARHKIAKCNNAYNGECYEPGSR